MTVLTRIETLECGALTPLSFFFSFLCDSKEKKEGKRRQSAALQSIASCGNWLV